MTKKYDYGESVNPCTTDMKTNYSSYFQSLRMQYIQRVHVLQTIQIVSLRIVTDCTYTNNQNLYDWTMIKPLHWHAFQVFQIRHKLRDITRSLWHSLTKHVTFKQNKQNAFNKCTTHIKTYKTPHTSKHTKRHTCTHPNKS